MMKLVIIVVLLVISYPA
ncbi:TPA: type I toxin-antitoxin system Ibs family toxin, partial [Escherichia coli]|nr:type I toxin-antitoxin system Ibs family toxin [Escherichia coli]